MGVTTQLGSGVLVSNSRVPINDNFTAIDNALDSKVDDSHVLTNVPANAIFTDTIFIHPSSDGSLHVIPTSTIHSGYGLQAGSTAGSLTWVLLDKTVFGVNNLDDTADLSKPISTAQQTALNLKAGYSSPTFSGTVTATTFSGALTGNASTATKTTQDGNGNTITSTYINLSSSTTVTASKQTAKTPSLATIFGKNQTLTSLNESTGLGAGTYTLQNLIQQLVNRAHKHQLVTRTGVNCNCNCDCTCTDQ